jgi:hypothetical protein
MHNSNTHQLIQSNPMIQAAAKAAAAQKKCKKKLD